MSLKIANVNIERSTHLERLKTFIHTYRPDVLCLQELTRADIPLIEAHMEVSHGSLQFMPCMVYPYPQGPDYMGIGIVARQPLQAVLGCDLIGRQFPPEPDDKEFRERMLFATIWHDKTPFRIGTTHLNVTKEGRVTPLQMESVRHLINTAREQSQKVNGLLLTGDFNAPRHREAHNLISANFIDGVPMDYKTSIDNELHKHGRNKAINFVVDGLFHTPGYRLEHATLHSGVSDHMALTATLSLR